MPRTSHRGRLRRAAPLLIVALLLAGCASTGDDGTPVESRSASPTSALTTTAPTPTATVAPPDGITVTIDQQRLDIPLEMMSIQVHNGSGRVLEIVGATYTDARFAEPLVWSGDTTVPTDIQRDLRIPIPAPDCAPPADAAPPHVTVQYLLDGAAATGEYTPTDPFDFVALRTAADCFKARVAETADIRITGISTRATDTGDVAEIQISIDDHGTEPFTLSAVSSTVLFQPATGETGWTPATTVQAGESTVVTLDAIPSRCDAHALAEDKVGTRFDATVAVGSDASARGMLTLVATDAQRSDLYAYFSKRCGLS